MQKKYHFLIVYICDGEVEQHIIKAYTLEYAVRKFVEHYIYEDIISITRLPGVIN